MNFQIFGDRVLLEEKEEEREVNGIAIPESASRAYLTMRVVAVGDGKIRNGGSTVQRRMCVNVDDHVLVQFNPMMLGNNHQKIGNKKFLALNQHDIIARIDSGVFDLTLDAFHPVGRWVLVRVDTPERVGTIFLPGSDKPMQSAGEIKLYLAKMGDIAAEEIDLPIGVRVLVEHARVTPFKINRVHYAYIDAASVVGAYPEETDPGVAAPASPLFAGRT